MENISNTTCESSSADDYNLGLHIMAVFIIFVAALIGSMIPIVFGKIENVVVARTLFIAKFFGAGVILTTGIVHIFPEAVETLLDPCLPEWFSAYPSAGLFTLIAILSIHCCEWATHQFVLTKPESDVEKGEEDVLLVDQRGHNISTYSLELGIMVHSVIIGVSLGVATDEFTSLLIALCFHQFFEGLGLGHMISKVNFSHSGFAYLNALVYSITTPAGVAIGIGIQYSTPSAIASNIAIGIFESFAAGLLLYSAVVHLMARSFLSNEFTEQKGWQQGLCFFFFYFGCAVMSVIAIWA